MTVRRVTGPARSAAGPNVDPRGPTLGNVGTDPDPRFTFANERTFLAWNRTALALIAGGLAAARFLRFGGGLSTLSVAEALIAFGGYMSVTSYRHWQRTERALRLSQPPPPSALPRFLAGGVSAAAIAAAGLAVLLYAGK
jgi:putative membrane protein